MRYGKLFKKIALCFSVLLVSLLPYSIADEIDDEIVTPNYSGTHTVYASISISGGSAECMGYIKSSEKYDTTIYVYLKQYKASQWTTIASWSGGGNGGSDAGGNKSITSGYKYKVVATGRVYDSSGSLLETITKETGVKSY